MDKHKSGIIAAGLALFSMFFGAGDLIWPLILGGRAGDHNFFTMMGFLISGVSLPLLGLLSMMLFMGDTKAFFSRIGQYPGMILLFIIQAILGPIGSLPRLFTLAHATLLPYFSIDLLTFSLIACLIVFAFALKPHRIVDILGVVLAPVLILSLAAILILGFYHHPQPVHTITTDGQAFFEGLKGGYNTLDMIASFIFAPIVISYFIKSDNLEDSEKGQQLVFKKMVSASLLAGGLLSVMFFGLTYVASYYTHLLPSHDEAERLGLIALHLIGPSGALFACVAIALSCLTTAIPIALISANYIHQDLLKGRISRHMSIFIPLAISAFLANLGFMGIAKMLEPILLIVCPGLIILSVFNILYKVYEMQMPRMPIYVAFGLSFIGYIALPYL
jgi:LIVCS family branched-chain amino acid:cation transporter